MQYVLGLDIGTSGVKALLLSENGEIVRVCGASYAPDVSANGHVEQHPAVWWENTRRVIQDITKDGCFDIAAIGCSGQMHSSVFLDANGEVVRPAILWNDTRTTEQVRKIHELAGGEAQMLRHVYNRALEGFTLPKILWLKENEPENFQKVRHVVLPKDYINYMLTGRLVTDFSDAAGTVAFDVKNRRWSNEIIEAAGLTPDIFPPALESTAAVGTVRKDLAAGLGLPEDVTVIAGGADNSCAAIGNGIISPGEAVISIGTSGTVVAFLDAIPREVTGDVHLFNYSYPGSYYAMGCMLSAGESLNWLKRIVNKSFDEINTLAENVSAGCDGLLFLPYLFGERCPYNDPHARGVFFGLTGASGAGELARAVMEGVAYNIKGMFDLVENFAGVKSVRLTGGGAKSGPWSRIIACVLDREIGILNVEEGPALGAALIAAVGRGVFGSFPDAIAKTVQVKETVRPDPEQSAVYRRAYEMFKAVYEANRSLFAGIRHS